MGLGAVATGSGTGQGAYGFAERLRLAVCDIDWTAIAPDLHVTVSLGAACGPAKGWPVTFTSADGRLLAAKRQGRNAVVISSTTTFTA